MSGINGETSSDKVSNFASDASGGVVGQATLLHQTTNLVSHTIDFAKGEFARFKRRQIHKFPVALGDSPSRASY